MRNLQIELESIIKNLNHKPKLMLHTCCAPCATYVIDYLKEFFDIYVLYYNPNIAPLEEWTLRKDEVKRLCDFYSVEFLEENWENEQFNIISLGLEDVKEGGIRCHKCFELRLKKTEEFARKYNCEYFTTTLSISPLKNAQKLCEIGEMISTDIKYLPSDFKKKEGYKKSTIISKSLNLYRQNYCGCIFSKRDNTNI